MSSPNSEIFVSMSMLLSFHGPEFQRFRCNTAHDVKTMNIGTGVEDGQRSNGKGMFLNPISFARCPASSA